MQFGRCLFKNCRNIFTCPAARSWISLACPMFPCLSKLGPCWLIVCGADSARGLQFSEAIQGQTEVSHAFPSHIFLIADCIAGWDLWDICVSFGMCLCADSVWIVEATDLVGPVKHFPVGELGSCFCFFVYIFFHLPALVTCPTQASIFLMPQCNKLKDSTFPHKFLSVVQQ